ncbi:hypothetical protein ACKVMT_17825 [Halobacteriales archaeon Cl-PHB]
MSPPPRSQPQSLDLPRDAEWAVHHLLVQRIEAETRDPEADDLPPLAVYRLVDKLETGDHRFTQRERWCLLDELDHRLESDETPARDRPLLEGVRDQLRDTDPAEAGTEAAT